MDKNGKIFKCIKYPGYNASAVFMYASPLKYIKMKTVNSFLLASCCQPSNCLIIHSKDSAANRKG